MSEAITHTVICDRPVANVPKTVHRCDLTINCEEDDCPGNSLPWVCESCKVAIEYGFDDGNFYCDCGMSESSSCTFYCSEHGPIYSDPKKLKRALDKLEAPPSYTILLLGETNVGKSTWINAFANYLTYPTLDTAVEAGDLITLIPNEFTYTDDDNECTKIRNGQPCDDEDFTAGKSSTQKCKVHRFTFGSTVIRIIDTPGIGDVRGAIQDDINFKDVLNTISAFDEIHAIMILLKPNQAALTVTFRYCIEELLTHLHKSAKDNIIFGFTNSRGTNYRPGDTMPALKRHLKARANDIKCTKENRYCFDSEGYRCLAELLFGIQLDEDILDSYKKSWNYSVREVTRLFSYMESLEPHRTKSTLSINNARILILQLAKPMAEVTAMILNNLDILKIEEDRIKNLDDSSTLLAKDLLFDIIDLERVEMDHPRTVCTNSKCVTMGTCNGKQIINYTTWCHEHCYLEEVPVEATNNAALRGCDAMKNGKCKHCSHGYEEHMHITYQLNRVPKKIENPAIRDMIRKNASTCEIKKEMVRTLHNLIVELKNEHTKIEKIAARFGVFLQQNSITSYNHARAEYLTFHINEQKKLAPELRDKHLIRELECSLRTYQEEVVTLTKAMYSGDNSQKLDVSIIDSSIQELYDLKHSGRIIKNVGKAAITVSQRSHREVSHRLKSKKSKKESGLIASIKSLLRGRPHRTRHTAYATAPVFDHWHQCTPPPYALYPATTA